MSDTNKRCEAQSPGGSRCTLEAGHPGGIHQGGPIAAVVPSESGAGDALSGKEASAMSRTASRDLGYGLTEEDRLRGWLISLPPEKYELAQRGEWNGAS